MHEVSVYLHDEIIQILKCFGQLNSVVNRLFEDCINNGTIFNSAGYKAPNREGARRVNLYIKDDIVSQLCDVQIRTSIYWFVENEIYSELDWEMTNEYNEEKKRKIERQTIKTLSELNKLKKLCGSKIQPVINMLEETML